MPYEFARQRVDYSDLSSGRVFHSLPGYPAFPIRLADEIFQRCRSRRPSHGADDRLTMYDPCCGGAYHLATLACLHWDSIGSILASDIDPRAVELASRNLALLTPEGLGRRIGELNEMRRKFGKESHRAAASSAGLLRQRIVPLAERRPISIRVFQANAMDGNSLREELKGVRVDTVFTDVPYGRHSEWRGVVEKEPTPMWKMLDALLGILAPGGLVAVVAEKGQRVMHEAYGRVEKFQIGKRQVAILSPNGFP